MLRVFTTQKNGSPYRQFALDRQFAQMAVTDEATRTITGYAIVFNRTSLPSGIDGSVIRLLPGSAIVDDPALALYQHDYAKVLGNTANATLTHQADDVGVKVTITLPDTQLGRDTFVEVRDKYVEGMSFGMYDWTSTYKNEAGVPTEIVSRYRVDEFTVTPIPRFTQTSVGVQKSSQAAAMSKDLNRARIAFARHRLVTSYRG